MNKVMQFLSLLLCVELILSPVSGSLLLPSKALAQDCAAGMAWNYDQNRCLVSSASVDTRNSTDACAAITDEDDRRDCYTRNANDAFADESPDSTSKLFVDGNGKTTGRSQVLSAAAVAVPLFFMIKAMKDGKLKSCKPSSLIFLYAGGAALLVGEVVTQVMHNKKLNKLNEKRKSFEVGASSGNADDKRQASNEAQSQAFALLRENELSLGEVAKGKLITYAAAAGLFYTGAIMATVEGFQLKAAKAKVTDNKATADDIATIKRIECVKETTKTSVEPKTPAADSNKTNKNSEGGGGLDNVSGGIKAVTTLTEVGKGAIDKSKTDNTTTPTPTSPTTPEQTPEEKEKEKEEELKQSRCQDDPESCVKECGGKWTTEKFGKGSCSPNLSMNLNDILNLKYKKAAIKNIASAESYDEMVELMAEIDALEFQNYSLTSYYGSETKEFIKSPQMPFDKIAAQLVSQLLIADLHAQQSNDVEALAPQEEGSFTPPPENPAKPKEDSFTPLPETPATITADTAKNVIGKNPEGTKVALEQVKGIFNKAVYTPGGRGITNTLLGGWMNIMAVHMNKVMKVSKARAALLEKLKLEFDSVGGIVDCTSTDRENPAVPRCYCFTSENKVNPNRSKSKVCSNTKVGIATTTPTATTTTTPKVCIDVNSGIDASCSCKAKKTCMKVSNFNMSGISPGTFKMMSAAVSPLNDLLSGNTSVGNLSVGSLGSNAARLRSVNDQIVAKDKKMAKDTKDMEKSLLASTSGLSMAGPGFSSGSASSLSGLTPKQASALLDSEIKKNQDAGAERIGTGGASGPATSATEPEFVVPEAATEATEISEVMKTEVDFGNNDINNGTSTNLFDVLSNRYQRSGMRRLFDEEGKTQADKPADKEIAE